MRSGRHSNSGISVVERDVEIWSKSGFYWSKKGSALFIDRQGTGINADDGRFIKTYGFSLRCVAKYSL